MAKKPAPVAAEPPPKDEAKVKPVGGVQFGPTASAPGSRLKKR